MLKPNHVDSLITSSIIHLECGSFLDAAINLQGIAKEWAKCGMSLKSFLDMKSYIIESARKTNPADDLESNLLLAEKELTKIRREEWQKQKQKPQHSQQH